jgi:hypothetical protein
VSPGICFSIQNVEPSCDEEARVGLRGIRGVGLALLIASVSWSAGCGSDSAGTTNPDGKVADLGGPDAGDSGQAVDFKASADTLAVDQGGGADTVAPAKPLLRIFDALQGASVIVCQDSNKQLGSVMERLVSPKNVVHGYVELVPGVETQLWVEPFSGGGCKNTAPSSSKLKLTPKSGEAYTAVIRALTLFHFKKLDDDLTPPSTGMSRVRFYNGAGKPYDLCQPSPTGPKPLALALANNTASAYAEREPVFFDISLQEVSSSGPCTGAVLGTVDFEPQTDHTHTFFLIAPKKTETQPSIAMCTDSLSGVAKQPSTCKEKAFNGSGN